MSSTDGQHASGDRAPRPTRTRSLGIIAAVIGGAIVVVVVVFVVLYLTG